MLEIERNEKNRERYDNRYNECYCTLAAYIGEARRGLQGESRYMKAKKRRQGGELPDNYESYHKTHEILIYMATRAFGEEGKKELYKYLADYPNMDRMKLAKLIFEESEYWLGYDEELGNA